MKKQCGAFAGLCLLFTGIGFAGSGFATAQDKKPDLTPPNVLVVQREMVKPGMAGMAHQKSESAFVQAMQKAKSPDHYFAATSMSGPSRALFFLAYDSFADWEKSNAAMMGDSTLATDSDSAMEADGKLLTSFSTMVFRYRPDLSISPSVDLAQMRMTLNGPVQPGGTVTFSPFQMGGAVMNMQTANCAIVAVTPAS